jgi:altronate hydrolase
MEKALFRVDPRDDVATALRDIETGAVADLDGDALLALEPIARGHKIAVRDVAAATPVLKREIAIWKRGVTL